MEGKGEPKLKEKVISRRKRGVIGREKNSNGREKHQFSEKETLNE